MEYHNTIEEDVYNIDKNIIKSNNENLILKKKRLIELSKNLTKIEYFEIFNIITEDNCQYSENKNGIFINLLNVSENTIDKIFDFINFIKHKKEDLIKHEEYLTYFKKNIGENQSENNYLLDIKDSINYKELSDDEYNENENKNNDYLIFSSDEDDDLENKISLKKKKNKYSGKKAKIIKSIKDSNDINKQKNKLKKIDE